MKRFTLYYRGELKSNGNAAHKHSIRTCFHEQLERRFDIDALLQKFPSPPLQDFCHHYGIERESQVWFAHVDSPAELDVYMLSAGATGDLVSGGGDIDNRLKTLFDALQVPDVNQIRAVNASLPDVFQCAIANDKLISQIRVRSSRLLDVPADSREVVVVIEVSAAEFARPC